MFTPFANRQAREFIDTMQLFEAVRETRQKLESYRGTMTFRNTAGHDYLVKWHYDNGKREAKVIGRRNAETEALERDFNTGRKRLESRLKSIESNLASQAKLNVAVGLGRLPDIAARILRAFERRGIGHQHMFVVGTNALYAYEALTGGSFDTQLVSTQDIDLFVDSRNALKLAVQGEPDEHILLNCLKAADRSFESAKRSYRATNRNGYMVDFIKAQRNPPWAPEGLALPESDLQPSPIEGLIWLENAPVIVQPVLDTKGYPVVMAVPDPRVFAIHKYWLSQKPERGIKARRDRAQAIAVAMLVMNELRHLPFDGRSLRMIPKEIFQDAKEAFEKEFSKQPKREDF
jgi:hypothetical protein